MIPSISLPPASDSPETPDTGNVTGSAAASGDTYIPEPLYPEYSRQNEEEGTVIIEIELDSNSALKDTKILQSSGFTRLDQAARDSLTRARFTNSFPRKKKIQFKFRLELNK